MLFVIKLALRKEDLVNDFTINLSDIDTSRFGVKIARAQLHRPEDVIAANDFCRKNNVRMLIARCPVGDIPVAQNLEESGARLMDSLVYYSLGQSKIIPPPNAGISVRDMLPGEEKIVQKIAAESFKNYNGHYHADPRLEKKLCDEAYSSWAESLCATHNEDVVMQVAFLENKIVGFLGLKFNAEGSEIILNGVLKEVQRKGVYGALVASAINWHINSGKSEMLASTQISNIAVQKTWVRLGFELSRAYYTFHKWFD